MTHRFRVAWLVAVLAAIPPAPVQPQTPTFRVSVDYVEVDAVVTDQDGQFVRGLTQDDFQLFDDGKPQTISAFSIVDIPVEGEQRPLYAPDAIEPDVASNERPFDGRVYVMVIDNMHTAFGRTPNVRLAARRFIQQHLGSNDLMAVVHVGGPTDAGQEFTNRKRLLLAAIDRAFGRKIQSATLARTADALSRAGSGLREPGTAIADPIEAERYNNARQSLTALRNVADWFTTVRGRRKTILFVSEGIDYDITNFENGRASLIMDTTRETLAAAARGNVSIYGIDPRGLTTGGDETIELGAVPPTAAADATLAVGTRSVLNEIQASQDSLRQLSDETGGFAVVNTNSLTNAFDRIVRDNSSYYAMAYYPPSGKPGAFHRLEVRVRRPDLRVRARRGYVTPPRASPAPEKARALEGASATTSAMTPEAREVLDSPLPVSGLSMRTFAAPFKGAAPNASVLVGIELRGRDLRLDATDKVSFTYVAVDATGKVRGGSTDALTLNLQPETRSRVAESGLRFLARLELPPGRYQIRFAAHDSGSGNAGSVHYDLEIPDFGKLPLSMSGLALTSAASLAEPTVRPDEALRQVLPGPPVAGREFPQNDAVAVFAEVYDNEASKPHKVDISTTVTTDEGRVVITAEEVRDSSELQGSRGGYGYVTRLSLKELAPGPYVLTIVARSRLGSTPEVQRQVQFTVTAPRQAPSR